MSKKRRVTEFYIPGQVSLDCN